MTKKVSELRAGDETPWYTVVKTAVHSKVGNSSSPWFLTVKYPDGATGIRQFDTDVEVPLK